jgi:hypothetical protein
MASVVATGNVFWQRWAPSSRHALPLRKDGLRRRDIRSPCAKLASVVTTGTQLEPTHTALLKRIQAERHRENHMREQGVFASA